MILEFKLDTLDYEDIEKSFRHLEDYLSKLQGHLEYILTYEREQIKTLQDEVTDIKAQLVTMQAEITALQV